MKNKLTIENLLKCKMFDTLDKNLITDRHINELQKILDAYQGQRMNNRLKNIYDFIFYDVPGDWLERINIIRTKLISDVRSDYALEIRYGKDNILKKRDEQAIHLPTLNSYIMKYGEEKGTIKYNELREKSGMPWGLKGCIDTYGEVNGPIKWEERMNKKRNTISENKKIKPYRNGRTLKEYEDNYGIEKGRELYFKRNEQQSYRFSKQYYIDNYGEEEGNNKWSEYRNNMDKTSLSAFIKKYGKDQGTEKYNNHIKRLRYVVSEEYYIEKYGEENGIEKWKEYLIKISNVSNISTNFYSKISQDLFWKIYGKLNIIDQKLSYFAELNEEYFFLTNNKNKRIFYVDFKLGNKIIEFDGDYWHSLDNIKIKDIFVDEYLKSIDY